MTGPELPVFALPAISLSVDGDPDGGVATILIETVGGTTATTLTADQLSHFAGHIIAWAGQAKMSARPQTTHMGHLTATPVAASLVGIAPGSIEGTVVLAFPVGGLTLAFEVPTQVIVSAIGRHLTGGRPEAAPPKSKPN